MAELLDRLRAVAEAQGLTLKAWLWMLEQGVTTEPAADAPTVDASPIDGLGGGDGPSSLSRRYVPGEIVGAGGMGTIRRVFDRALGRSLVRKELAVPCAQPTRDRFLDEARTTAKLQHPGVVPVHDVGELPDGRLFYTMREIQGRTLGQVMVERALTRSDDPVSRLRRLVEILRRICETMAFAHRHGVVHRDLKPENVMIGAFGEVFVVDWGLVKVADRDTVESAEETGLGSSEETGCDPSEARTRAGQIIGTPVYMPPEQASGHNDAIGPPSDVYALGAILYQMLCGRPPYVGPADRVLQAVRRGPPPPVRERGDTPGRWVPDELATICQTAMDRAPDRRYAHAGLMGEAIAAWLDGASRRAKALEEIARADQLRPRLVTLREQVAHLQIAAEARLEGVAPHAPVAEKRAGWALEDEAKALDGEADLVELEYVQTLQVALNRVPDLPEAHQRLADHYQSLHRAAEHQRDVRAAARAEALLKIHDRGQHAAYLAGNGAVTLHTDPPVAEVVAYRSTLRDRRLRWDNPQVLGHTPLDGVSLPAGSYLLKIQMAGRLTVRYPVLIERGGHWEGVPPGERHPAPIHLPVADGWSPNDIYVPAGWCRVGGDPEAPDSLSARQIWVDAFVIGRLPVTHVEFVAFLNGWVDQGRASEAHRWAPSPDTAVVKESPRPYAIDKTGYFCLDEHHPPQGPVVLVDAHTARAYAAWRSAADGHPWRLPEDLEWEKAARGIDGRSYPWGDYYEPTWTHGVEAQTGVARWTTVGAYPADESPYGVMDMAGNVRDWTQTPYQRAGAVADGDRLERASIEAPPNAHALRVIRGGAYISRGHLCRPAARFAGQPDQVFSSVGFRLGRSWAPS